jgi:hypothetical protein
MEPKSRRPTCRLLLATAGFAICAVHWQASNAYEAPVKARKTSDGTTYTVTSGRPLGELAMALSDDARQVITYEDSPILYPSDIEDVTDKVSRDPDSVRLRGGKGVLVPRNKLLAATTPAPPERLTMGQLNSWLVDVIRQYNERYPGGNYRVVRDQHVIHIVPMRTRLADGRFQNVMSILDLKISVASAPRTLNEQIDAILAAVSRKLDGSYIGVTQYPDTNSLAPATSFKLENVRARDALLDVLAQIDRPTRWIIYYDPIRQGRYVSFQHLWEDPEPSTYAVPPPPPVTPGPGPAASRPN